MRSPRACPRDFGLQSLESRRLLATVAPGFDTDVAYGGTINGGTAMEFSPDGRLWVTTQGGTVRVIQPNASTSTVAATFTVDSFFERGLLGIAFDPAFGDTNNYVYLYRTIPASMGGPYNRVSRFEVVGNTIDTGTEDTIMNLDPLNAGNHNGGGIHFGPFDGKLYVAVGENAVPANAQIVTNRHGKMLRLNPNPDNPIPADNPSTFIARQNGQDVTVTPQGDNRAIWALGLRNPYTFAIDPETGRMHINDVGASAWEEVNRGIAGANYGWSTTEGDFDQQTYPNFTRPVYAYSNSGNQIAVTGGSFYRSDYNQFGATYAGDYFFADLGAGWIRRLDAGSGFALVTSGGVSDGPNLVSGATSIVDLKVDDSGALYFLQRGGTQGVRVLRSATPQVMSDHFEFDSIVPTDAPHSIQFQFTHNVSASLGVDDLTVVNTTLGATILPDSFTLASYDLATNTATFEYDGILPDGDYTATFDAAGVLSPNGNPLAGDYTAEFFVLSGDLDRDRTVGFDDLLVVAQNYGETGHTFSSGNVDYSDDGLVDFSDLLIVAQQYGETLVDAARISPIKPAGIASPVRVTDDVLQTDANTTRGVRSVMR